MNIPYRPLVLVLLAVGFSALVFGRAQAGGGHYFPPVTDPLVKALGDYTRDLPRRLQTGQAVRVEGPYGRFDPARCDHAARQIWIAGGIGVTPFLSWLEALRARPDRAPAADLHYCIRDRDGDAFASRLEALCASLPSIRLHVHGGRQGGQLTAQALNAAGKTEVWFCGPGELAAGLRDGLRSLGLRPPFHQEAFEMR